MLDDAEDTAREHPFITASTAATTGILISDEVDESNYTRANQFVESSYVAIRRDAATGSGQHVQALAVLLNQSEPDSFGRWMQSHYATIFDGSGRKGMVERILATRDLES